MAPTQRRVGRSDDLCSDTHLGKRGKAYRYAGLVERDGVRYLGQSVLFVSPPTLGLLTEYLRREGIGHLVIEASVGPIVTN